MYLVAYIQYKNGTVELVEKPLGESYTHRMINCIRGKYSRFTVFEGSRAKGYHLPVQSFDRWIWEHENG